MAKLNMPELRYHVRGDLMSRAAHFKLGSNGQVNTQAALVNERHSLFDHAQLRLEYAAFLSCYR